MSAREVHRSEDSAGTGARKALPSRIRNYRIVAEPRTDPDLHKLAQLIIGMALARADAEREERHGPTSPRQEPPQDVGN
jgi:hypothetical protein